MSTFRDDGYRDGLAGKPVDPPTIPVFAAEYRDGYIVGQVERDRTGDLFQTPPQYHNADGTIDEMIEVSEMYDGSAP